ncbi:hypothetical protein V9T40_012647 [Parthenolecanium corni]|uniref:Kinesin motor domain-containing protein n=1 Tax=Parthenolecanium corni TaxID=536013 RepID=A0AAN9XZB3_9HEMI
MNAKSKKNGPRWKRKLYQRLSILSWLKDYNTDSAVSDLIAGITVGLTVMPQSLAYATLAGLEPQYGLYSAFAGCLVYCIFGSCKDITIGPTALMSLMTYQQVIGRNADFAVLLCFLTGIVQILMGFFHLGVLIDFISIPVTVGFTSATSVIIAVSQLKGLLGLKFDSDGSFFTVLKNVAQHIHETKTPDVCLGGICIIVLLVLRKIKDLKLDMMKDCQTNHKRIVKKALWLLSTARNAIVVLICSVFAYLYTEPNAKSIVVLTGPVKSGLPKLDLPPFATDVGNVHLTFFQMCTELGSSIVLVPVIAVLGNVAIAKAFASGATVDATQELFTLGICNMAGSFVSSMPVTGSFSRSAVNHASGVRTPIGGLYTGILILLALGLLTPYFYYIPKASLAAVIICAVIFMIEYEVVKPMWKSSRKDLIPTFATFVSCLSLGVELGILLGVGINIILLLIPSARPFLHYEKTKTNSGLEFLMIIPGNSLYFPAVDFLRTKVCKISVKDDYSHLPVVIDCRHILGADFTAAKGVKGLIDDFKKRNQPLYFYCPHKHVLDVLKCVCLDDFDEISSMHDLDSALQASPEKIMSIKTSDHSSASTTRNSDGLNDSESGPGESKKERIKVVVRIRPMVSKTSKRCVYALDNKITLSYMELYNECIKDLFNSDSNFLELRGNNNVQIIGLTEVVVTSPLQAIDLIKKGNEIRSVRYTGANAVSSRSHAILIIVLRRTNEQHEYDGLTTNTRQSKLLFVDLAGSERAKHTKNRGKRLQEGGHINKSLLALGNCISVLSNGTKASHVNFRDSKLTRILKQPLSGNYRTVMIAQINPALEFKEEAKNTLIYATKAMGITKKIQRNVITVSNHVPHYQSVIAELRDEVVRLKNKINEQSSTNKNPVKNFKAQQLKDEMISTFEERMKLRRELLDVDNHLLILRTEAEKLNQSISSLQSTTNKIYDFKSSASDVKKNLNNFDAMLSTIEDEQERYDQARSEILEKLDVMKDKAQCLENELHDSVDEEAEKELLTLFYRVHELEADKLSLQGERMLDTYELHRSEQLLKRYQEQQKISDCIITKQRQLIEGTADGDVIIPRYNILPFLDDVTDDDVTQLKSG